MIPGRYSILYRLSVASIDGRSNLTHGFVLFDYAKLVNFYLLVGLGSILVWE